MSTTETGGTGEPAAARANGAASVLAATRRLGVHAALFTQAVADRIGLASTDVECLEILVEAGRLSAGELASATGLTSGAATRMLDRLEQAGFVRRTADPADRRRVFVDPIGERVVAATGHFDALARAIDDAIGRYDGTQLETIRGYLETTLSITRSETARLRQGPGAGDDRTQDVAGSFVAPVAGVDRGRLVFTSGAPDVDLRGDPMLGDLVTATFAGATPRVRARGGVVTVHYGRFSWLDWRARIGDSKVEFSAHWRRDRAKVVLNGAIPWDIELRGGASALDGDLRAVRLSSFLITGGANRISLRLPEPRGVVVVRVTGGMSDIALVRPVGSAARLRLRGGASLVTLDGQRVTGVGNVALASEGAETAASRYEIEVEGGTNRLTVSTAEG